jgi:hypothetical protein
MKVWENIFQIGVVHIFRKFSIGSVWSLNTNLQNDFSYKNFPTPSNFLKVLKSSISIGKNDETPIQRRYSESNNQ